jgi:hypothetical protein
MASTYTDGLAVEIIGSGDKAGSWGDVTNNNLKALEEGISGYAEIDIDPAANTSTLNIPDGQTAYTDDSKGRSAVIKWTGNVASGTHHTVTLQVGEATATQARFTAINGLDSTHTLRITTATMAAGSAPTYLEIPNGYSAEIHIDGAVKVINSLSGLAVEKIALKNNEIISNETDDEIIIAADTVKVGDDGAATLSSNGDQDLILKTGNSTTGSITITDGSSGNIDITPNGTGEVNIAKVDIDAGAIDGTIIGAAEAEAGTFTTLAGTTSVTTPSLTAAAALGITTVSDNDITITPHGTGETVMTKVDINGGAIDGTIIGAAAAAAGEFTSVKSTGTTSALHLSAADSYASFGSIAGGSGHGVKDNSGTLNVKNTNSDGWGQPYHSGMVNGEGAYYQADIDLSGNPTSGATSHSLSTTPRLVMMSFVCIAASGALGYDQNDEVNVASVHGVDSGGSGGTTGFSFGYDASAIWYSVGGSGNQIRFNSKGGGADPTGITLTEWDVRVRAWK